MQVEARLAEILEAKNKLLASFVESPCKSFDVYMHRVGEWQGLDRAEKIITQNSEDR